MCTVHHVYTLYQLLTVFCLSNNDRALPTIGDTRLQLFYRCISVDRLHLIKNNFGSWCVQEPLLLVLVQTRLWFRQVIACIRYIGGCQRCVYQRLVFVLL